VDPQLPSFLHAVQPELDRYGYGAVGLLIFLESIGAPLPGETVLIAAAVYAGTGRLNPFVLAVVAVLAAVVGDNTGYAVGRVGGARAIARFGRLVLLTPDRFEKGRQVFRRHGPRIVFVARFVAVLRQVNGLLAGTAHLPWRVFAVVDALGSLLWVGCWTTVGYFAGNHIDTVWHAVTRAGWVAAVVAVVVVVAVSFVVTRRRRRRGAVDPTDDTADPAGNRSPSNAHESARIAGP
jgi:membrane protein DedA with SNARE-associated domain